jgi:cytochrome c553
MKRSTILIAALLVSLAPLAMATPAVMKEAKTKNPATAYSCTTCHAKLPGTKANLNEEGLKWVKK